MFNYIDSMRDEYVAELLPFISQPSISASGHGILETAEYLCNLMNALGIESKILADEKYPAVFGQLNGHNQNKSLLFLCHYDVVPPGPLTEWENPPFEPFVQDNRIWGRGAGDAKGQLFACLKAVEAWRIILKTIPVNIKFLFIGDEEIGCPTSPGIIEKYSDLLSADGVIFPDASTLDVWGPVIFLGNRGVLALEFKSYGPKRDAHSGSYGGVIRNPANRLSNLLASLRDSAGNILIDGFYNQVKPIGEYEKELISTLSLDKESKFQYFGIDGFWGDPGFDYFETQFYRPTLNIHSLFSGYQGPGWMPVVPTWASAKVDINIVPFMDINLTIKTIKDHLLINGYSDIEVIEIARDDYSLPVDPTSNFFSMVKKACNKVWNKEPKLYPSIGGAGTLVNCIKQNLNIDNFLMIPFGQPDMNEHSASENFHIEWFTKSIKMVSSIIHEFSMM